MSADMLREAAALMRSRAEGSTDGPWVVAEQTHGEWYGIQSHWTALGTAFERVEAEHIASWHPAVALAVADLLTAFSMMPSASDPTDLAVAVRVAHAYLGHNP